MERKNWQQKKKASWYESRAKFSPDEVRDMNIEAYDLGAAHVLEATAQLYGLGPKRLIETQETLERTSYRELHEYAKKDWTPLDMLRHLTKYEAAGMNQEAYSLGVEHTLESVGYAYRLGDKRLDRIRQQLEAYQDDLGPLKRTGNIYEARLLRDMRRAKNPSKKGAVLDE